MKFSFSQKKFVTETARRMRRDIVEMTTEAGSGHPTSSLSAVELMSVLFFDDREFFQFKVENPEDGGNDRLIFSKGHAAPLLYALWAEAGGIERRDLCMLRKFGSQLEGHPTRKFPFTEIPTGSLGQGLAVGVGEAIALRSQIAERGSRNMNYEKQKTYQKIENKWVGKLGLNSCVSRFAFRVPRIWVLLGDSELAEGSVWEAVRIAAQYALKDLIAIVDVNRLGQRGETMDGWSVKKIARRFESFGWNALCVDGHDIGSIRRAYAIAAKSRRKPTAIIAKTVKGRGVSFLENKEGWHGKVLTGKECQQVLREIGEVDEKVLESGKRRRESKKSGIQAKGKLEMQGYRSNIECLQFNAFPAEHAPKYAPNDSVSVRSVYGKALIYAAKQKGEIVALDAEVSNSTFAIDFARAFPKRFFEMYIAEQTMVGVAAGLARRGYLPFISTFAAFFSRAFDQLRMAQYADVPMVCVGSHCGVSIGEDGASQMGLEDLGMFRALLGSVVLYPSDAVSMWACVVLASERRRIAYIRSTRAELPVLYSAKETFCVGGSKTVRSSENDIVTIVAAGVTVHEALKAYEILQKENIFVRVIDAYSIKPIDTETIGKAAQETKWILTVEDHFVQGGLGDAVRESLSETPIKIVSLAVRKCPMSGTMEELLRYEEIDAAAMVKTIKSKIGN